MLAPLTLRCIILLSFITVPFLSSDGQQRPPVEFLKTIVPPSPNAASLGKYGAWPVDLYTGVPAINIPIYEVKGRSVSVPIALSYHASGIKVSEIASWVGLGWSLQAGGLVTRSIRGLPDEEPNLGYLAARQAYPNPADLASSTVEGVWKAHMAEAVQGAKDSEHDVYVFNALGRSYKFLFQGDGTVSTIPYSNVKVTPDFAHDMWTIYLEDGTKLIFGGTGNYKERSTTGFGEIAGSLSFTSSWYLRSITTTVGEVVNFSYLPFAIKQDVSYSQSDYIQYSDIVHTDCIRTESGTSTSGSALDIGVLLLSTIDTDLERIDFIPQSTERLDLQGGRALSEIRTYSKLANAFTDNYKLKYSYSDAISGNELHPIPDSYKQTRLKLESLVRDIPAVANPQVWSFEYNPQRLPSRNSLAQDHWGYFNGKTQNNSLLYKHHIAVPNYPLFDFIPPAHDIGGNREGDANYITAEILTRINYPTKGHSSFEYEANTASATEQIFSPQGEQVDIMLYSVVSPFITSKSVTFEINFAPQTVYISMSGTISGPFDQENVNIGSVLIDPDQLPVEGGGFTVTHGGSNGSGGRYVTLTKTGLYRLGLGTTADQSAFIEPTSHVSGTASISYERSEGIQTYDKLVGGIHVTRITDSDGGDGSKEITRHFTYEYPLIIDPFHRSSYISEHLTYGNACTFKRTTRSSTSKFSLGLVQGGHVGYEKITTKYGPNAENGYTVSFFTSEADEDVSSAQTFPYPPTKALDWRRGLLREETHYKNDHTPVSRVVNTYTFEPKGSVTCFKAGYYKTTMPLGGDGTPSCPGNDPYQICDIARVNYVVKTEQVNLTSSTQTTFSMQNNALVSSSVVTNYHFDSPNNTMATRTTTTNSKNETITNIKKTPFEKNDIAGLTPEAAQAIDYMAANNMMNVILEEQVLKNNTLLKRTVTNSKLSGSLVLPDNIFIQLGSGPFEKRVEFTRYDAYGNLLEQSKLNDMTTAYIWGYKGTLLVAEVKNATYQQIINVLDQNVLDALNTNPGTDAQIRQSMAALRSAPALQKAMITTYTHKPAAGPSSVTDPNGVTTYYEYDSFNRVSIIKDSHGSILKTFDYHYKQ